MTQPATYTVTLEIKDDTDQNFIAFITEKDESERLQLSKKLKKTYAGVVEEKQFRPFQYINDGGSCPLVQYNKTYSFISRSPLEIVANMKLLPQVETLLTDVFIKIEALNTYGQTLLNEGFEKKGKSTKELAQQLKDAIIKFKSSITEDNIEPINKFAVKLDNNNESAKNISKLIQQGHKTMGNDRNWSDHIAHICLALTGIGLLIMLANKLYSGQFFLNSTKRQMKLDEINQETLGLV
jgi:hypothetical protein